MTRLYDEKTCPEDNRTEKAAFPLHTNIVKVLGISSSDTIYEVCE